MKIIFWAVLFWSGAHAAELAPPNVTIQKPSDEAFPIILEGYKPIYGILGNPYTKIEISFSVQLMEDSRFYFGYTQLLMWNLVSPTPYFFDVNYNPLLWYRTPIDLPHEELIDFIPEEHESNGQGFSRERAWDRVGLDYHRRLDLSDMARLRIDFKVWYAWHMASVDADPSFYNPGNTDLQQYRGIWEATLKWTNPFGESLGFQDFILRFYPGLGF